MREADANKTCADYIRHRCLDSVYYKHCDKMSKGRPDSTFTWRSYTSWLEFKMLSATEGIHDQLHKLQLVELVKLEKATPWHSWVIAFRKANPRTGVNAKTHIYRPTALVNAAGLVTPISLEPSTTVTMLAHLETFGVATFEGLNYDAVYRLIEKTHAHL